MPIYRGHSFATQVVALHPEHGRLRRVVIACDLGEPHKPERYVQQVEGSVQAGLKYALREKLLTEEGIPKVSSLCHSEGMAPNSLPHIQTILVAASNSEQDASMLEKGEGDVAMFGVAPALASAIEQLHGQRYFELPMEKANLAQPLREEAIIKSS